MNLGRTTAILATLVLGACASPAGTRPSLAPRSAESIDPRVPVVSTAVQRPVDPALARRLGDLVGRARQSEAAFTAAAAEARRLAAAAGPPQSESWIAAQQAVSVAVAARAPVTRALGDVDAIAAEALARLGGMAPADLAAVEAAAAEVGAIDRREAAAIDDLQRRLGG
jgi:ribonuclease D